jgi:hypothetical protein
MHRARVREAWQRDLGSGMQRIVMTKPKHDRLLTALIAKLPPETERWPRGDRIAWLRMMAMAFDVVYGPCGSVPIGDDIVRGAGATGALQVPSRSALPQGSPELSDTSRRFYVDRDGFAMADGKPLAMDELPPGAILWDERGGVECGDLTAILWRDIGSTRRSLPPGVTLKTIVPASDS